MTNPYADALLKAVEQSTADMVYRVLLETQKLKTFPLFLGTADLQALSRQIAYDYRVSLKKGLDHADDVLRFDSGGGTDDDG